MSEADEHEARIKETNVEYRRLYTHTAPAKPGFETRS
jgi:hypothetical protein